MSIIHSLFWQWMERLVARNDSSVSILHCYDIDCFVRWKPLDGKLCAEEPGHFWQLLFHKLFAACNEPRRAPLIFEDHLNSSLAFAVINKISGRLRGFVLFNKRFNELSMRCKLYQIFGGDVKAGFVFWLINRLLEDSSMHCIYSWQPWRPFIESDVKTVYFFCWLIALQQTNPRTRANVISNSGAYRCAIYTIKRNSISKKRKEAQQK